MANGGLRPGSGRKKGSKSKITIERERMLAEGLKLGRTPLDVWRLTIDDLWEQSEAPGITDADRLALKERAAAIATMSAPYLHPKLHAIHHSGTLDHDHRHAHVHAKLADVGLDLTRYSAEQLEAIEDFAGMIAKDEEAEKGE